MKHEFTDSEITVAADQAVDTASYYRTIPIDYLKAFLDALPEPEQDVWQTCPAKNVRKGDRVRWKVSESEDNESYEIVVTVVTNHTNDGGVVLHSKSCSYFFPYGTVVDHIPAPVQHPDPEEHPVIIVSGAYGVVWDKSYAYISDGSGYHIAEPNNDSVLLPKAITKWGAAKVVACDEM